MNEQDKQLLLKDLCTRLLYGVFIKTDDGMQGKLISVVPSLDDIQFKPFDCKMTYISTYIEKVKPYLRPMSSMTEEEKWDFGRIFNSFSYLKLELLENGLSFHEIYDITGICDITWNELNTAIDWLNAHHFDYRGLIEKGLALKAPKDMYKI